MLTSLVQFKIMINRDREEYVIKSNLLLHLYLNYICCISYTPQAANFLFAPVLGSAALQFLAFKNCLEFSVLHCLGYIIYHDVGVMQNILYPIKQAENIIVLEPNKPFENPFELKLS